MAGFIIDVDRREVAAVFVGGALGTSARAWLSHAIAVPPGHWPWPTFIANVIAAILLGLFTTGLPASSLRRPLLCTGLCGGLSTFSTMQLETVTMLEHGYYPLALCYTIASIIVGLLAIQVTTTLVRRRRSRR